MYKKKEIEKWIKAFNPEQVERLREDANSQVKKVVIHSGKSIT